MAFCPQCGAQVEDGATVCPQCGASMNPAPAPQSAPAYYEESRCGASYDADDISNNKVFALAAYLLGPVGIIIAMLAAQNSPFAMFHARQSLKLSIVQVILVILCIVPILGWIAFAICSAIMLVVEIIMIVHACKGEAVEPPIVGELKFLK